MSEFFEFTENGVRFKQFPEVRKLLEDRFRATFGEDIDLSPTSPDGHHVDLEAKTIGYVSEGLEVLTTMLNRWQAKGQFLDLLASFLGISRHEGESDSLLRQRMNSADRSGIATYDGMLTYLRDVLGSDVSLAINDDSVRMDGMEPHSLRVSVPRTNESSDDKIASAIWRCKPGGIKAIGNSSGYVIDGSGKKRVVCFSRPSDVQFDVKVSVTLYSEESFPSDGVEIIEARIRDWSLGNGTYETPAFAAGTDIIPLRFIVPILSVPGIQDAVVLVKKSESGTWTGDVISITSEEKAVCNNIEVKVL